MTRISKILNDEQLMSADVVLRSARYVGGGAQMWLNLQAAYDLARAIFQDGADMQNSARSMSEVAA